MRHAILLLALAAAASGQWVESTILLPDSIGGISYLQSFGWCPAEWQIYVGGYTGNAVMVLDAEGRRILDLHPGPNDVSRLSPGVYIVRPASGVERGAPSVTNIVVTR